MTDGSFLTKEEQQQLESVESTVSAIFDDLDTAADDVERTKELLKELHKEIQKQYTLLPLLIERQIRPLRLAIESLTGKKVVVVKQPNPIVTFFKNLLSF